MFANDIFEHYFARFKESFTIVRTKISRYFLYWFQQINFIVRNLVPKTMEQKGQNLTHVYHAWN